LTHTPPVSTHNVIPVSTHSRTHQSSTIQSPLAVTYTMQHTPQATPHTGVSRCLSLTTHIRQTRHVRTVRGTCEGDTLPRARHTHTQLLSELHQSSTRAHPCTHTCHPAQAHQHLRHQIHTKQREPLATNKPAAGPPCLAQSTNCSCMPQPADTYAVKVTSAMPCS
jgi:hypothetical protein